MPSRLTASRSTTLGRSSTYLPMKSYGEQAARALLKVTRWTPSQFARISSLARAAITFVASVSAGPPWGGLYLKPPSLGGLWLGVTTIPSARPPPAVRPPVAGVNPWAAPGGGGGRGRAADRHRTAVGATTPIAGPPPR